MNNHEAHQRHSHDAPTRSSHEELMRAAIAIGNTARMRSRPNPWVGAVVVCADGAQFEGATEQPGSRHAEIVAMDAARAAGASLHGATMYTTLEPCSHTGRTGPCCEAIVAAGITRVVTAVIDPDPRVAGNGLSYLQNNNVEVITGVCEREASIQLAAYLHHRRTGRAFVMLKTACTLDARTTLPDGPRWITGDAARKRVHELRAESDAIATGMGTVVTDDPALTVRDAPGTSPQRIVLSRHRDIPASASVLPALTWRESLPELLEHLGSQDVLQLMVEAGPTLATAFHQQGLVDRYIFHVAPIVSGHPDAAPVFFGEPCASIEDLLRGTLIGATNYDDDIEIVLEPQKESIRV
jgi:diaminohydroxyphosphoribosylaminopyrimidine deaminase/5-amino-6-(5-phosphoribosylamino)uracil reductase